MNATDKKSKVDELFHLFQRGEWEKATDLFSGDAQITRQYGERIATSSVSEFIQSLKSGPLSQVGIPEYINRKVSLLEDNGFVEQHRTRLTIKGQSIELPVCIIGKMDDEGKVITLEEYLDPSPIIKVLTQSAPSD